MIGTWAFVVTMSIAIYGLLLWENCWDVTESSATLQTDMQLQFRAWTIIGTYRKFLVLAPWSCGGADILRRSASRISWYPTHWNIHWCCQKTHTSGLIISLYINAAYWHKGIKLPRSHNQRKNYQVQKSMLASSASSSNCSSESISPSDSCSPTSMPCMSASWALTMPARMNPLTIMLGILPK